MTITPFQIYLFGIADNISCFFTVLAILAGGALSLAVLLFPILEDQPEVKRRIPVVILTGILSGLLAALIPSQKTIAMMVVVPAIVNSQPIQKDVPELYKIAVDALKEKLSTKEKK